jgi:hypothetical protein
MVGNRSTGVSVDAIGYAIEDGPVRYEALERRLRYACLSGLPACNKTPLLFCEAAERTERGVSGHLLQYTPLMGSFEASLTEETAKYPKTEGF